MNAFLSVVNLLFDPSGGPFGLHDEASANRPIEFLLFLAFLPFLSNTVHSIKINSSQPTQVNENQFTLIPVHGLLKTL